MTNPTHQNLDLMLPGSPRHRDNMRYKRVPGSPVQYVHIPKSIQAKKIAPSRQCLTSQPNASTLRRNPAFSQLLDETDAKARRSRLLDLQQEGGDTNNTSQASAGEGSSFGGTSGGNGAGGAGLVANGGDTSAGGGTRNVAGRLATGVGSRVAGGLAARGNNSGGGNNAGVVGGGSGVVVVVAAAKRS